MMLSYLLLVCLRDVLMGVMFRVVLACVPLLSVASISLAQERVKAPAIASGTGFYVSQKGHILTNAHVVAGCTDASVAAPIRGRSAAQIVARDSVNDLALLLASSTPRTVPPLRSTVRIGEAVAVYGFPLAGVLPSSGNFTMGHVTATAGLKDDKRMLQISAPVQPGNSGGPLLDATGSIVGVVTAQIKPSLAQNVNFAIRASVANAFLARNGVSTSSGLPNATQMSSADLAERAQQFTVFVTCRRSEEISRLPTLPQPAPNRAGGPTFLVGAVTGAPGDGNKSLKDSLQRALSNKGLTLVLTSAPSTFRLDGLVAVGDTWSGGQSIHIQWLVMDGQGRRIGRVDQINKIPRGSLDGSWGTVADKAAAGAVNGIIKLFRRIR